MHDRAIGVVEDLVDEWKPVGSRLPHRREQAVDHAVSDQTPEHARISLHRVEVAVTVPAPDRQAGDQVVEHEIVQHDDPAATPERSDDPTVSFGVVADVVQGDIGAARRSPTAAPDNLDLEAPLQLGQEQRAVVGDPGALGRKRRVVRDLHAPRSRSTTLSHDACSASFLPARPHVRASSGLFASRESLGDCRGLRLAHEAGLLVGDDLERPAGIARGHDGLLRQKGLVRHEAQILVHRRVEDGPAPRVQARQLLLIDSPCEPQPTLETLLAGQLLEAWAFGPLPRDDGFEPWVGGHRFPSRSTRLARSRRPTDSTKSPYSSQR